MDNRTILVLQGPNGTPQDLSSITAAVATIHGHMTVVHAAPVPPIPSYEMGAMPYGSIGIPDTWISTQREIADLAAAQANATKADIARAGISGEVAVICDSPSEMDRRVIAHTFIADIAVILSNLRQEADTFRNLAYGVMFHSPIPLMLNATAAALTPKRVLVAWNSSLPAARAIHAALPMLKAATEVSLCTIDPSTEVQADSANIAAWLSHHGCKVTVHEVPGGGAPVADVLLRSATEVGADLVVMGAFGHSRMQQRIFGGTTRSMMDQTGQAVLLAH